jgi:hypothetical protein
MNGEANAYLLDALDALHVLGPTFTRERWIERFRAGRSPATGGRAWERLKAELRERGVPVRVELERGQLGGAVLTFEADARRAIEALLPPIEDDDQAEDRLEAARRRASRRPLEPRDAIPHAELEAHARELWARGLLFATPAAFAGALTRERPDLWRRRAKIASRWYRQLAGAGSAAA